MISIYLIAYNEEVLLPYTIRFYRSRFPGCDITVYDNFSTDRTKEIALKEACKVVDFYTGGKLSDQAFIDIKNNCWKDAKMDFVVVCDVDEWLNIDYNYLNNTNATIIRTYYADMVNLKDNLDIDAIDHGVLYNDREGKWLCFNRNKIKEINYSYGAHDACPNGDIIFSEDHAIVFHYRYINLKYIQDRYEEYAKRLSGHNIKWKLSYHYKFSPRKIVKIFNWNLRNAKLIPREI